MWIFTRQGFASVVQDRDDEHMVIVRARVREDLARISLRYFEGGGSIISTPAHDYPYRFIANRAHLAAGLLRVADDLRYTNFKTAAHDIDSSDLREDVYATIWSELRRLRDRTVQNTPGRTK